MTERKFIVRGMGTFAGHETHKGASFYASTMKDAMARVEREFDRNYKWQIVDTGKLF